MAYIVNDYPNLYYCKFLFRQVNKLSNGVGQISLLDFVLYVFSDGRNIIFPILPPTGFNYG